MYFRDTLAMAHTVAPTIRGGDHLCLMEYDNGTYQGWFSSPGSHYPIGPIHTSRLNAICEYIDAATEMARKHPDLLRYNADDVHAYHAMLYAEVTK